MIGQVLPPLGAATASAPEDLRENVIKPAEPHSPEELAEIDPTEDVLLAVPLVDSFPPEAIILPPLLVVGEDCVCLRDLLELPLSLRGLVPVRVKLHRKLPVGIFDLVLCRSLLNPE